VGPTCQREGEEGEGNSSGGWLAGPGAVLVAGLVWLPEAFFSFSLIFFFSFSFETILFEFKFGIKLELRLSKTFSVHMELKKWVFDNKR
jgi:hypothetical protein